MPEDGANFRLLPGQYIVRVFAKRVSDREPHQLTQVTLTISESQATQLRDDAAGIYFDWGPDQQAYHAHVELRKLSPLPPSLLGAAN